MIILDGSLHFALVTDGSLLKTFYIFSELCNAVLLGVMEFVSSRLEVLMDDYLEQFGLHRFNEFQCSLFVLLKPLLPVLLNHFSDGLLFESNWCQY